MKKVALALSSGGARGFAHIGVIERLEHLGYEVVGVTGCSMGALVGGVYAAGGLSLFKEWATSLQRSDVFKLYDLTLSSQGIIKGERVFKEIEKLIPENQIEKLSVPFKAVATDMRNAREIVFESGSLYNALRASTSIPGVVKPMAINGQELLDGGILNPLPMNHAMQWEYDLLVAVDVNSSMEEHMKPWCAKEEPKNSEYKKRWDELVSRWFNQEKKEKNAVEKTVIPKRMGFFDLMLKSTDLMQDELTRKNLEIHAPNVVVEIPRCSCGTFEYYKAQKMIDIGEKACDIALQKNGVH